MATKRNKIKAKVIRDRTKMRSAFRKYNEIVFKLHEAGIASPGEPGHLDKVAQLLSADHIKAILRYTEDDPRRISPLAHDALEALRTSLMEKELGLTT